jgi:hypothetical protein
MKIKVTKKQIFIAVGIIALIVFIIIIIKLLQPTDTPPKTCDGGRTFYCGKNVCKNCGPNKEITQKTCDDGKDDCTCKDGSKPCGSSCCGTTETCTDETSICCDSSKICVGQNGSKQCCSAIQSCDPDLKVCVIDCGETGRELKCANGQKCIQIPNIDNADTVNAIKKDGGTCSVNKHGTTDCSTCYTQRSDFITNHDEYPPKLSNFQLGSTFFNKNNDPTIGIGITDTNGNNFSFLPPTGKSKTETDGYYSNLSTTYKNIESNRYMKSIGDTEISSVGVCDYKLTGPSLNVGVFTGNKDFTYSDCLANAQNFNAEYTYYIEKTEKNPEYSYCVSVFDYKNVQNTGKVADTGYDCFTDGHTKKDTSCDTLCKDITSDQIWYNQPTSNLWGCSGKKWVNQTAIHPEDTQTNFCPDYNCNELEIRLSTDKKTIVLSLENNATDFFEEDYLGFPVWQFTRCVYGYYIRIVNKTSCSINCDFDSNGKSGKSVIIPKNYYSSGTDIAVGGASYDNNRTTASNFTLSFVKGQIFSTFQIQYNLGNSDEASLTGFSKGFKNFKYLSCTLQTATPNQLADYFSKAFTNSITIVVYPTIFQKNNKLVSIVSDAIDLKATGNVYARIIN